MKGTYRIYAQRRFAPFDWEKQLSTRPDLAPACGVPELANADRTVM